MKKESNQNGSERNLPFEMIPVDYVMFGEAMDKFVSSTGFGYHPHPSALLAKSVGGDTPERIVVTFCWGTSQADCKQEPVKVLLDVPPGYWKEDDLLIVNLDHVIP